MECFQELIKFMSYRWDAIENSMKVLSHPEYVKLFGEGFHGLKKFYNTGKSQKNKRSFGQPECKDLISKIVPLLACDAIEYNLPSWSTVREGLLKLTTLGRSHLEHLEKHLKAQQLYLGTKLSNFDATNNLSLVHVSLSGNVDAQSSVTRSLKIWRISL